MKRCTTLIIALLFGITICAADTIPTTLPANIAVATLHAETITYSDTKDKAVAVVVLDTLSYIIGVRKLDCFNHRGILSITRFKNNDEEDNLIETLYHPWNKQTNTKLDVISLALCDAAYTF